jgi:hypothetical protein
MKRFFVLVLLGLCACMISGCFDNAATTTNQPNDTSVTNNGPYLTKDNLTNESSEIYVTEEPIDGVSDYVWIEPGTGEYSQNGYYYSDMGIKVPYATKWSDGSFTLSIAEYEGVDYAKDVVTSEFNDTSFVSNNAGTEANGNDPDVWKVGNAPDGHSKSDYSYDESKNMYVYNNTTQEPESDTDVVDQITDTITDDSDDDEEDINDIIDVNDGLKMRRR